MNMKKILILLFAIASCGAITVKADPLFPFFVDIVMDFSETPGNFTHYVGKTDGGGEAKAGAFLKDVLPASYKVKVSDIVWPDGRKVRTYSSSMHGDKVSVIYFITSSEGFSIEYAEGLPSEVPAYTTE